MGERLLGRGRHRPRLASRRDCTVRLAPPLEWVPSHEPDHVFNGTTTLPAVSLDIKSASYQRNGSSSWTVNKDAHERAPVVGYIAANLRDDVAEAWYCSKTYIGEHADLLSRDSKSDKASQFYRAFFPQRQALP